MDSQFDQAGFEILPGVLSSAQCDALIGTISALAVAEGKSAGLRNLLQKSALVSELASSNSIRAHLELPLGELAFPVRALFFDKTQNANWRVSWHQDLTIAVAERIETAGYGPWSVKAGVPHVEAPGEILESMLTLRCHLDDCTRQNGALRVIPGSHRFGKLSSEQIDHLTGSNEEFICELNRGDALLMRPLLLHASWPAEAPQHRRVIHIEYGTQDLPNGLCWHERKHSVQYAK